MDNIQIARNHPQDVNSIAVCHQLAGDTPHFSEHSAADSGGSAYDFHFESDFEFGQRLAYLTEQIEARTGGGFVSGKRILSQKFVIQQALERYFLLIGEALNGIELNKKELEIILNATCSPVCQWGLTDSLARLVADDNGVDDIEQLQANPTFMRFLIKLQELTKLQEAALVDFCERFWRMAKDGDFTFKELCSELGFELAN